MRIFKLILIAVLIMPFLFVMGTIASSAEIIGFHSVGNYSIQTGNIAAFGKGLKEATEGIVMMEIDIARNIIHSIKQAKPIGADRGLHNVKRSAAISA